MWTKTASRWCNSQLEYISPSLDSSTQSGSYLKDVQVSRVRGRHGGTEHLRNTDSDAPARNIWVGKKQEINNGWLSWGDRGGCWEHAVWTLSTTPACVSPWTDADSKSTLSPLTSSCSGTVERGFWGHIKSRGPIAPACFKWRTIINLFTHLSSLLFSMTHDIVDKAVAQVPRTTPLHLQLSSFSFIYKLPQISTLNIQSTSHCEPNRTEYVIIRKRKKRLKNKKQMK